VLTRHTVVESAALENGPPASVVPASLPAAEARPAPWDSSDLFPPKPEQGEYGWRFRGRSQACTRDELIERCRSSNGEVDLVWTPETPRLVPPAEVPWLLEPLRRRARGDLRHNLRIDAGMLAIFVAYLYYTLWWLRLPSIPPLYLAMFLVFAIVPAAQDIWALARLRKSFGYLAEQAAALRYGVWLGGRRIVASYLVAGALVAVWAAQVAVDAYGPPRTQTAELAPSIAAAGLVKPAVHQGEWWRLLTAELLHGHWLHIGLNVLSLLAVGRLLEVHASPVYVSTVFLISAFTASLASLYLSPGVISVGASGGIMGLVGFLAVLGYRRRRVLPRGFLKSISLSIALTAGAGLVAYQLVDNAAHLGGLVGGVILGLIYVRHRHDATEYQLRPSTPARVAGYFSCAILFGLTLLTIWLLLRARLQGVAA
jgi:membrane associated rhomboid family serine protease